jgi:hypothetical protein
MTGLHGFSVDQIPDTASGHIENTEIDLAACSQTEADLGGRVEGVGAVLGQVVGGGDQFILDTDYRTALAEGADLAAGGIALGAG